MAYSKEKDKLIEVVGTVEGPRSKIEVAIYSYDGAAPKIAVARFSEREDGSRGFQNLGRLTREEAEGLLPLLKTAIGKL
ncbi:MAG TPA: hypothetical protein VIL61_06960 [Nitrospiria bacterium]|jgi:hypothetical protein